MRIRPLAAQQLIVRASLAAMPAPRHIRRSGSREIAAELRGLFRTLGMRGISVTCGRSRYIHITLPALRCPTRRIEEAPYRHAHTCQRCALLEAAERRVRYVIGQAFPDLDDRSDYMTDYFDFIYLLQTHTVDEQESAA